MKYPQKAPLFVLLASLLAGVTLATAYEEDFTPIFDGKDLSDWEHKEGAWKVENGAIVCTGEAKGKNWIIWRGGELKNFELRVEFKYVAGNSGVQVRSDDIGDFQVQGYQVEVAAQDKMGLWHHSLAPEDYRKIMAEAGEKGVITAKGEKTITTVAPAEEVQAAFKKGEWNEMTIIAQGSTLIQKVNGVTLAELVDEDEKYSRKSGVLAFQDHGKGTVAMFRNIRLKPLP